MNVFLNVDIASVLCLHLPIYDSVSLILTCNEFYSSLSLWYRILRDHRYSGALACPPDLDIHSLAIPQLRKLAYKTARLSKVFSSDRPSPRWSRVLQSFSDEQPRLIIPGTGLLVTSVDANGASCRLSLWDLNSCSVASRLTVMNHLLAIGKEITPDPSTPGGHILPLIRSEGRQWYLVIISLDFSNRSAIKFQQKLEVALTVSEPTKIGQLALLASSDQLVIFSERIQNFTKVAFVSISFRELFQKHRPVYLIQDLTLSTRLTDCDHHFIYDRWLYVIGLFGHPRFLGFVAIPLEGSERADMALVPQRIPVTFPGLSKQFPSPVCATPLDHPCVLPSAASPQSHHYFNSIHRTTTGTGDQRKLRIFTNNFVLDNVARNITVLDEEAHYIEASSSNRDVLAGCPSAMNMFCLGQIDGLQSSAEYTLDIWRYARGIGPRGTWTNRALDFPEKTTAHSARRMIVDEHLGFIIISGIWNIEGSTSGGRDGMLVMSYL